MDLRPHIPTYNPDFFTPKDLEDAKRIVLGYGDFETTHKWELETAWARDLFVSKQFLNRNSVVLDWGCGVGRLSKMMIDTFECSVIGVDFNKKMLEYAQPYVNSDKFLPMTVEEFSNSTIKCTNAIAVWALQHSIHVDNDIDIIKKSLVPPGEIFVFENNRPTIPIIPTEKNEIWFNLLHPHTVYELVKRFNLIEQGNFPSKELNIPENESCFWAFFKNNKTA